MLEDLKWLSKAALVAMIQPRVDRHKATVLGEYSPGWESYARHLEGCSTLDEWLRIQGVEDSPRYCNVSGKMKYQAFNSMEFNKRQILQTIQREFPDAQSVTEYGCGIGRNLLYLKRQLPHVAFYGYELCPPGVEIARTAAGKFGLDVKFSQLDYVEGPESDYVFPKTDIAFTMYSLEQLPTSNKVAVENILRRTVLGSIHLEPVPENYPYTLRGILGRVEHWKADYLKNFERNVASIELAEIKRNVLNSAHNPLMFPTLYVLKKA